MSIRTSEKAMYGRFEKLFEDFLEPLTTYAYRYVNDWQVAEDIVQDTFLSLWMNKEFINFDDPIKPYLYRSVYNKSINHLQTAYIKRRINPEDTDALIDQIILEFNQYDSLLLKEVVHEIDSFIETLPPQCKKVYRMSRGELLKNKEIALALGISEKAVEKNISRALNGIRVHLRGLDLLPGLLIGWLFK